MDLDVLRDGYLTPLLDKISNQNKSISVPSDFNVDLLKYHYHTPANEFLDSLSSHISLQYFIQTTRVSSSCKTLIVNICSYILSPDPVLGNRSATILLHNSPLLPRSLCSSSNISESDLTNFRNYSEIQNYILGYFLCLFLLKKSLKKSFNLKVNLGLHLA